MKKLLAQIGAVAMALLLAFSFAACGRTDDNSENGNSGNNGGSSNNTQTGGSSEQGGAQTDGKLPEANFETAWKAAFDESNFQNFKMTMHLKDSREGGYERDDLITIEVDGNLQHLEQIKSLNDINSDEVYYDGKMCYEKNKEGVWYAHDGRSYGMSAYSYLRQEVYPFAESADEAKYSEELGGYVIRPSTESFTDPSLEEQTIYITYVFAFKDGKIEKLSLLGSTKESSEGSADNDFFGSYIISFIYGGQTVTLPQISGQTPGGGGQSGFVMPEGGFDTTKDVTITFYNTMGARYREVLQDHIVEFNKLYPNIHIEPKSQGDWDTLRDIICTELAGGINHPDIAYCYTDHVADYNFYHAVLPLDDFLPGGAFAENTLTLADGNKGTLGMTQEEYDRFNPNFLENTCFADGKMYTLPWAKSTEMLFYNKTFFDEHGLTPPATWDEMETLCAKIKAIDSNITPFGYDSESNWFINMCAQLGSVYTSAESPHFRFDNAQNRALLEKLKDWYDKGYFTTVGLNNGLYSSNLFTEESIYMSIGSTAGASYYFDLSSGEAKFEVGVVPIPQADPAHPKAIAQGPSVCIFKNDDPQKVLASWLFIKYMTTNVDFQAEFSLASGYMPVLKEEVMRTNSVYNDWLELEGDRYLSAQTVKACLKQGDAYFAPPAFLGSFDARKEVGNLLLYVCMGTKSIDAAFRDALAMLTPLYGE